ncbi:MAG: succinic semialdehyde dehydrogenase [Scrofimicrobium sp.]
MDTDGSLPKEAQIGPDPREMQDRAFASFCAVVPEYDARLTEGVGESRTSPLTGLELPGVTQATTDDVARAFAKSRNAQRLWKKLPLSERAKILRKFESLVWRYQDQILDVIQWETGKPRKHAFEELLDASQNAGYVTAKGPRILRTKKSSGAVPFLSTATVAHQPLGVVGVVSPWNYPFTLAFSDACAALLAGNTVVLKPASQTALTGILVAALLGRSGLPQNVFQLVLGPGRTVGEEVARRADYLMFTGSTKVGRSLAELCGQRLIGFSGELGGKNPSIVFPDADLEKWASTARRECFSSSGQLCVSTERIYIHDDIWDRTVALLIESIRSIKPGRDMSWTTDYGPLVDAAQFLKVSEQVQDAVAKGATVLTGGVPLPSLGPTGYAPTVLTDVTESMEIYAEETFGAVVSLYRWRDIDEVIDEANDSSYGLNGSIWCGDRSVAMKVAGLLEVGSVSINEAYGATWGAMTAPIGGFKESGVGRRHGPEGILKYTETQTVSTGPRSLDPWFGMTAEEWAKAEEILIRARNKAWRWNSR